jgi:Predicted glycosyltransferases
MIKREFPEVRLLCCTKNRGIASYNKGFEVARGKFIVTLNNDSYPDKKSIGKIMEYFKSNKHVGIIQGRIINVTTRRLFYPTTNTFRSLKGITNFVVTGAAIRKEVLTGVGNFPESVFLFGAEFDLSLRALSAGFGVEYCDDILFYHLHRPEYMPSLFDPFFYHVRSYYWIIWRRYPFAKAIDSTLWLMLVLLKRAFRERKIGVLFAATMDTFLKLPSILRERKTVNQDIIRQVEEQTGRLSIINAIKERSRHGRLDCRIKEK